MTTLKKNLKLPKFVLYGLPPLSQVCPFKILSPTVIFSEACCCIFAEVHMVCVCARARAQERERKRALREEERAQPGHAIVPPLPDQSPASHKLALHRHYRQRPGMDRSR